MVNSGSYKDRNEKATLTQGSASMESEKAADPVAVDALLPCKSDFKETADDVLPSASAAIEPKMLSENADLVENKQWVDEERSCCNVPVEKVHRVLSTCHTTISPDEGDPEVKSKQNLRKVLCLYCDRSFGSPNVLQKHVQRSHFSKQNRRVSSRRQNLTVTPCVYCDKLNNAEHTLKDLFQHLTNEHSNKYYACFPCEERFFSPSLLIEHNASSHPISLDAQPLPSTSKVSAVVEEQKEEIPQKITRSRFKTLADTPTKKITTVGKKSTKLKDLRSKKLSVKTSRIALKRSKRLQAKAPPENQKIKHKRNNTEKKTNNSKVNSDAPADKSKSNSTCVNPYPEFDSFYRVKKITDHSIDNLKISSLTFDDVFDKAFFNRIKCNIQENLIHHIDGKLFKNEESENRISNFEKTPHIQQEVQKSNSENYGCDLSLNAVTPVASLSLNSQFGEDFESQIEYGAKPSKKKNQTKTKDEVHYKYFTRRKYQASILEHKENRDLSKLDMWTQLVIKNRQQQIVDDKKSDKEILDYTNGDEYKNKIRKEELNRILDRRGPFEDLKEEASKQAALDKSSTSATSEPDNNYEAKHVLDFVLNRAYTNSQDSEVKENIVGDESRGEIPSYLNLRRTSTLPVEGDIDKSDKIALICSSQETENFELPTNSVRARNELVELTGEWARTRMYICAACGKILPNMKMLLEHKSFYHQNVWVQHYEFVGNQSKLYRHLSIPGLGKVGVLEDSVPCRVWKRSDARLCTKCGKQCNALAELHRHILECGGDWTWMLARKKCKYRPFGAKSRRKRRGLVKRNHHVNKTERPEKKPYKKPFDGPRPRPSDADTIQKMLANLPAKRSTRKIMSLQDSGIYRSRKSRDNSTTQTQNKMKCGKLIYKNVNKGNDIKNNSSPKTIKSATKRNFNTVLSSRILDTNSTLRTKRILKNLANKRITRQTKDAISMIESPPSEDEKSLKTNEDLPDSISSKKKTLKSTKNKENLMDIKNSVELNKRVSPRKEKSPAQTKKKLTVKKILTGKINIKSFFPVKKKKKAQNSDKDVLNEVNVRTTRRSKEAKTDSEAIALEDVNPVIKKNSKKDLVNNFARTFSISRKKNKKSDTVVKSTELEAEIPEMPSEVEKPTRKRKLKRSFRSVVNKVKKMKTGNKEEIVEFTTTETENTFQITKPNAFLGEAFLTNTSLEMIVAPSILEKNENIVDNIIPAPIAINFENENEENPTVPETIFNLETSNEKSLQAKGELNFDSELPIPDVKSDEKELTSLVEDLIKKKPIIESANDLNKDLVNEKQADLAVLDKTAPISIETTTKPQSSPLSSPVNSLVSPNNTLLSPTLSRKSRKPGKGLNDCIAMLTSKLQQRVEETKIDKPTNITQKQQNSSLLITDSMNISRTELKITEKPIVPKLYEKPIVQKPECILKIPTFRTPNVELVEQALDLTKKSNDINTQVNVNDRISHFENLSCKNVVPPRVDFADKTMYVPEKLKVLSNVDLIIENVVKNKPKEMTGIPKANTVNAILNINNVLEAVSTFSDKNSVDDIIEYVVNTSKDVTYKLPTTSVIMNEEENTEIIPKINTKAIRKIGSQRNTKTKSENIILGIENTSVHLEDLNKAFSQSVFAKDHKAPPNSSRKVGQIRNRNRKSKIFKSSLVKDPEEKLFLETNMDNILNTREIVPQPETSSSKNIVIENQDKKETNQIELISEDEPQVLENKLMSDSQQTKETTSDSEDDVPLAVLLKSEQKEEKSESERKTKDVTDVSRVSAESKKEFVDKVKNSIINDDLNIIPEPQSIEEYIKPEKKREKVVLADVPNTEPKLDDVVTKETQDIDQTAHDRKILPTRKNKASKRRSRTKAKNVKLSPKIEIIHISEVQNNKIEELKESEQVTSGNLDDNKLEMEIEIRAENIINKLETILNQPPNEINNSERQNAKESGITDSTQEKNEAFILEDKLPIVDNLNNMTNNSLENSDLLVENVIDNKDSSIKIHIKRKNKVISNKESVEMICELPNIPVKFAKKRGRPKAKSKISKDQENLINVNSTLRVDHSMELVNLAIENSEKVPVKRNSRNLSPNKISNDTKDTGIIPSVSNPMNILQNDDPFINENLLQPINTALSNDFEIKDSETLLEPSNTKVESYIEKKIEQDIIVENEFSVINFEDTSVEKEINREEHSVQLPLDDYLIFEPKQMKKKSLKKKKGSSKLTQIDIKISSTDNERETDISTISQEVQSVHEGNLIEENSKTGQDLEKLQEKDESLNNKMVIETYNSSENLIKAEDSKFMQEKEINRKSRSKRTQKLKSFKNTQVDPYIFSEESMNENKLANNKPTESDSPNTSQVKGSVTGSIVNICFEDDEKKTNHNDGHIPKIINSTEINCVEHQGIETVAEVVTKKRGRKKKSDNLPFSEILPDKPGLTIKFSKKDTKIELFNTTGVENGRKSRASKTKAAEKISKVSVEENTDILFTAHISTQNTEEDISSDDVHVENKDENKGLIDIAASKIDIKNTVDSLSSSVEEFVLVPKRKNNKHKRKRHSKSLENVEITQNQTTSSDDSYNKNFKEFDLEYLTDFENSKFGEDVNTDVSVQKDETKINVHPIEIETLETRRKPRRKSKTSKKIDNKHLENSLFEDFTLVIKSKRKSRSELVFNINEMNGFNSSFESFDTSKNNTQVISQDDIMESVSTANDSFDDVDMELDEMPATNVIIERNLEQEELMIPNDVDYTSKKIEEVVYNSETTDEFNYTCKHANEIDCTCKNPDEIPFISEISDEVQYTSKRANEIPFTIDEVDFTSKDEDKVNYSSEISNEVDYTSKKAAEVDLASKNTDEFDCIFKEANEVDYTSNKEDEKHLADEENDSFKSTDKSENSNCVKTVFADVLDAEKIKENIVAEAIRRSNRALNLDMDEQEDYFENQFTNMATENNIPLKDDTDVNKLESASEVENEEIKYTNYTIPIDDVERVLSKNKRGKKKKPKKDQALQEETKANDIYVFQDNDGCIEHPIKLSFSKKDVASNKDVCSNGHNYSDELLSSNLETVEGSSENKLEEHILFAENNIKINYDTDLSLSNLTEPMEDRRKSTRKNKSSNNMEDVSTESKSSISQNEDKITENISEINNDEKDILSKRKLGNKLKFKKKSLETPSTDDYLEICVNNEMILENGVSHSEQDEIIDDISKSKKKTKQVKSKTEDFLVDTKINEEYLRTDDLRRSRRASRKIASYNENELDPILDEIESNKKKSKRKESKFPDKQMIDITENIHLEPFEMNRLLLKKPQESQKKLNSDELFDLLKASSNEVFVAKSQNNTLYDTLDNSEDLGEDKCKFDDVFENIIEKSMAVIQIQENMSKNKDVDKIYEFTESPEEVTDIAKKNKRSAISKSSSNNELNSSEQTQSNFTINSLASTENSYRKLPITPDIRESSADTLTPVGKPNYCDICKKSFIRVENLIKHKRTLTHISKLSEIEAKEAEEKAKAENIEESSKLSEVVDSTSDSIKTDINISDILTQESKRNETPLVSQFPVNSTNHTLKLADIINDVLNKPVLDGETEKGSFSDIIMQNTPDQDFRRYKSLGERKSFDSENPLNSTDTQSIKSPYYEQQLSKTTLEKQISLLQNIIDNQSGINYIDDISISSRSSSVLDNSSLRASPSVLSIKDDSSDITYQNNSTLNTNLNKPNPDDTSFLKPNQYEEVSEDSGNVRNFEEKPRKTLNRDEELFLECCSLLKSGSEVSNYSKKSNKVSNLLQNMDLKQNDEPEWLEQKSVSKNKTFTVEYSDNSRIPTPLGDNFVDDASNSNTINSQWNVGIKENNTEESNEEEKSFTFEEVLQKNDEKEKSKSVISRFGGMLSKTIKDQINAVTSKIIIGKHLEGEVDEEDRSKSEDLSDSSSIDNKKVMTKGAMKVFEGLKVSIPTEELNLEEVLNCSPKTKKNDQENGKTEDIEVLSPSKRNARKSKPVKNKSQFGSKLLFKKSKSVTKMFKKRKCMSDVKDVYDFEETQDNSDVFTKPDYRSYKTNKKEDDLKESDNDSRDNLEVMSFEANSVSSVSSLSNTSQVKKSKTQQNMTKNKCMIMGRIFKNAVKSKVEEEIRHLPVIDNNELVENYVEQVKKTKLTDREMNVLFDQLLENKEDISLTEPLPKQKPVENRRKSVKQKQKKRTRANSDSTDDEFSINKTAKKRAYKKNPKPEDNCINLEQELKECIGVASRKSQRKCTSGKQNVLVEYWSSDDSAFEALLESQIIEPKENKETIKSVETEIVTPIVDINDEMYKAKDVSKPKNAKKKTQKEWKSVKSKTTKTTDLSVAAVNRRKRAAVNPLYHWSSSSEDESSDLIQVKPIREELEDEEDRPIQHGWIVGDSPKKLVTLLAHAKGKKTDIDCVKEQKKRTNSVS